MLLKSINSDNEFKFLEDICKPYILDILNEADITGYFGQGQEGEDVSGPTNFPKMLIKTMDASIAHADTKLNNNEVSGIHADGYAYIKELASGLKKQAATIKSTNDIDRILTSLDQLNKSFTGKAIVVQKFSDSIEDLLKRYKNALYGGGVNKYNTGDRTKIYPKIHDYKDINVKELLTVLVKDKVLSYDDAKAVYAHTKNSEPNVVKVLLNAKRGGHNIADPNVLMQYIEKARDVFTPNSDEDIEKAREESKKEEERFIKQYQGKDIETKKSLINKYIDSKGLHYGKAIKDIRALINKYDPSPEIKKYIDRLKGKEEGKDPWADEWTKDDSTKETVAV